MSSLFCTATTDDWFGRITIYEPRSPCTKTDMSSAALPEVTLEFSISRDIANLSSSLDCAGVAATAVIWSYLTKYNQKWLLICSLGLVAVLALAGAKAPSITVLLAMRFLGSAAAAGIIPSGVAEVNRLWPVSRKGMAMGVFFLGPQACPALGPVVGGVLTARWGWRSLQYFQAAWAALMLVLIFAFLPGPSRKLAGMADETIEKALGRDGEIFRIAQPNALLHRLLANGTESGTSKPGKSFTVAQSASRSVLEPFRVFGLLQYKIITMLLYIAGFQFATSSNFLVAIQCVYSSGPYNYNALRISLMYLPYAVGCIAASVGGGKWSDRVMHRSSTERSWMSETSETESQLTNVNTESLDFFPEDRLEENVWIPVCCVPAALVAFGWVIWKQPFWVFPVSPPTTLVKLWLIHCS